MSNRSNPVSVFDFTIGADELDKNIVIKMCNDLCKKWVFQLEKGEETGYLHYQGRVSLKNKDRDSSLAKKVRKYIGNDRPLRVSPTNNISKDDDFYVTKENTRIEGPWNDKNDQPIFIPDQLQVLFDSPGFTWRPFQQDIMTTFTKRDFRTINVLIDEFGNSGKSIIKTTLSVYKKAMIIPMINDYKDIMRLAMDAPKLGGYILDMPRAIKKEKLYQIYGALEHVKDGYAYDDRYNFRYEHFNSPIIWVFTNRIPDTSLMSTDRWKFWKISDEYELVSIPTPVTKIEETPKVTEIIKYIYKDAPSFEGIV